MHRERRAGATRGQCAKLRPSCSRNRGWRRARQAADESGLSRHPCNTALRRRMLLAVPRALRARPVAVEGLAGPLGICRDDARTLPRAGALREDWHRPVPVYHRFADSVRRHADHPCRLLRAASRQVAKPVSVRLSVVDHRRRRISGVRRNQDTPGPRRRLAGALAGFHLRVHAAYGRRVPGHPSPGAGTPHPPQGVDRRDPHPAIPGNAGKSPCFSSCGPASRC